MEDHAVLSFQAPFEGRLLQPLIRRLMLPIVASVGAVGLLMALLVEMGGYRHVAVMIAGSSVLTTLILPTYAASEAVKRNASKFGKMIAYRIDRNGVQAMGGFTTHTLAWSEVTRIERRRNQVALYYGRRRVQSIPTGTLTAEQRVLLERLLTSSAAEPADSDAFGQRAVS